MPEDGVYWFTFRAGCQRMEYIGLPLGRGARGWSILVYL